MAAEVNDDGGMAQKRVSETATASLRQNFVSGHHTSQQHESTAASPSHPLQLSVPTAIRPRYASPDELDQVLLTPIAVVCKNRIANFEVHGWKALDDEPRIRHVVGNCIHLRHRHAPIRREILSHLFVRRGEPLTMSTPGCVELNQYRVGGVGSSYQALEGLGDDRPDGAAIRPCRRLRLALQRRVQKASIVLCEPTAIS